MSPRRRLMAYYIAADLGCICPGSSWSAEPERVVGPRGPGASVRTGVARITSLEALIPLIGKIVAAADGC